MLKALGIALVLGGLAALIACAVFAAMPPRPVHLPLWAGIGSTSSFAIGMLMLCIALRRQRQLEVLARIIVRANG